ncbi:MAG: hypothetical protein FJ179_04470 [Gammaproteobacteria bacterium]|nr:hypothetical protein [Gammaproteobacteria bacterium]
MKRKCERWLVLALIALLTLTGCDRGAAPLSTESLQIRINLLCTTCDDFLRCERAADVGRDEVYRLYRLREKSFWAQIATIWDYLVQWLRRKTSDSRPLTIYENDGHQKRVALEEGRARVDMAAGLITLPDSSIDMRSAEWRTLTGELQGRCLTLKRRDGYAWVRGLLGRELPKADSSAQVVQ